MYGHGFATMFLASCYGEEQDREKREKMKDILTRAVKYIAAAQSTQGGYFYTSRVDGHDQDEGSVTVTQIQALRACKNAGIPVPKETLQEVPRLSEEIDDAQRRRGLQPRPGRHGGARRRRASRL